MFFHKHHSFDDEGFTCHFCGIAEDEDDPTSKLESAFNVRNIPIRVCQSCAERHYKPRTFADTLAELKASKEKAQK